MIGATTASEKLKNQQAYRDPETLPDADETPGPATLPHRENGRARKP
jgi:hypothetical protein